MNTASLLERQKELGERLERLTINFKKDSAARKTPEYLSNKKNDLDGIWKAFDDLHKQIEATITEDHPYFTEQTYEKAKKLFDTTSRAILTLQEEAKTRAPPRAAVPHSETSGAAHPVPQQAPGITPAQFCSWGNLTQMSNLPKLPPMKIPKFSGDHREWKMFMELFSAVIDSNNYLSDVEKMQYLLYQLEGEARKIISHLQLSGNNYNTALRLIKARFNNNRKIVTTYINTILDAKKIEYRNQEDVIALHDTIRECLEAIKNFNYNTDEWGPIIVCVAMRKLDTESLRLFEEALTNPREMPSTTDLLNFLEKRYQVLDCIKGSRVAKLESQVSNKKRSFHTSVKPSCSLCSKDHHLYQCAEFKKLDLAERVKFIGKKGICTNCLAHNRGEKCKTTRSCFYCKKRHHTLLHREAEDNQSRLGQNRSETKGPTHPHNEDAVSLHNKARTLNVLLPTALVKIKNIFGHTEVFRALIDPGSQVSLITEEAVQRLKLRKEKIRSSILGVGGTHSAKAYSKVKFQLQLQDREITSLHVEALVLPKLSSLLPESPTPKLNMEKYGNIMLADPTFNKPGPIDILLGTDVYANIILDGLKPELPAAQNTKLGWIIFGSIPNVSLKRNTVSSFISTAEIDQKMEQFWEIDDDDTPAKDQLDDDCSEHFKSTHSRDNDGRYIVHLPFKKSAETLGNSKNRATARLLQLERKLRKSPNDKEEYDSFLKEYWALGHMSPAEPYTGAQEKVYYLPHHAVFKRDSTTTKLRVVFDGSCKTDSGISLNDILHSGPKIQQDLGQILLRWRKHRYVFTADLEKMFRQIKLAKEDRNYQRILWRQHPTEPIQEFTLNTVTYGTAPASYLAIKTLKQLAEDEGDRFPLAKEVLIKDFYVDDMLTGADSRAEAQTIQKETIALLRTGGFNLRKWTSNCEELLKTIPEELLEKGILEIGEDDSIKTLGIHWNPRLDEFEFSLNFGLKNKTFTKRELLSRIASLFDPLGWLAPVTVTAKLIMQALWKAGTDWDQVPPLEIVDSWKKLESEINKLQAIKIPRWIKYREGQKLQIHGFCDASEKAYAAVVYARTSDTAGNIRVTLLTAKTKVAPLRQKTTLPRLELCGALLLAQLIESTVSALQIKSPAIFAWCDSEIALAWIAKNPNNWQTFVANRVSKIQRCFDKSIWRHVSSSENPADIASRGISPSKLTTCSIWWRGPLWLTKPPESWPERKYNLTTEKDIKKCTAIFAITVSSSEFLKSSAYISQVRIIAYCLRFAKNCKLPKGEKTVSHLSTAELQEANRRLIKMVQREEFAEELASLEKKTPLKKCSKLLSLNPFLDSDGIIRVGGRIEKSNLPADSRHQALLPKNHHLTNIIIDHAHRQTLHGGVQLTLNYIRTRFWIIDGKRVVQGRIHKCVTCVRHRQKSVQPLMGNLPAVRVTPSPPFSSCGVDYAGPFLTKASKGRGIKTTKGYISLFICMVTKAVHLEFVSDLTTEAFLAAYRRFISRRGKCGQIYSDNGTNFVGAQRQLDRDLQMAIHQATKYAAEALANDGTEWKFLPAASPHLGGLWEAGVKSVKGHLKRVLGETLLTYEEFSTVLCQVEACLNSRPIGQQSSDPNDLEPLTPGHFLIGRPLIAPPVPEVQEKQIHQRWKLVTKLQQDIWKRWSAEYLSLLQQRTKWKTSGKNPSIGELVLVKEDNLPPQKWCLGRIVELHPGDDEIVRVVSVQHKNAIKKRPLNKLCQLPINMHNSEDDGSEIKAFTATVVRKGKDALGRSTIHRKRKGSLSRKHYTAQPELELWSIPEHFDKISPKPETVCNSPPPTKRRRPKIAPCTWASRLLHTTILMLYWLTMVFATDYDLIQPKFGLYIENLGSAQVKRGNLRLQVSLPVDEILSDRKNVENVWSQTKELCTKTEKLTSITRCNTLFEHLSKRKLYLLKATDEVAKFTEQTTRKRRGLLGKLLTSVFGVNDGVYREIEDLQHNQQSILQLTNQEVLLLNTKINQSNFVTSEKLRRLDNRLAQVVTSINEMTSWYTSADHNRISIEVISAYITAEDYFDEIQQKYDCWINALHDHAHILEFISLYEIKASIQNISQRLGDQFLILPTPQKSLDLKTENNTIKLYGYLNIIERAVYKLIHVTPIPHTLQENKIAVAKIRFSTIAVNFDLQSYFNLGQEDLRSCFKITKNGYLCTPTIIYNIDESPSCVIDEIYERHPKTKCELKQLEVAGTIWKALAMKNTWLYITVQARVISIICKGSREEVLLNGTGIIRLADHCHLKTKEVTLKTSLDESVDVITSHMKEITFNPTNITFARAPSFLQSGALIPANKQIIDYKLEPQHHEVTIRRALLTHSISTTAVITLALISLGIWRYWASLRKIATSCNWKHSSTQTDQPRQQESLQHHFERVLASGGPQHVHA